MPVTRFTPVAGAEQDPGPIPSIGFDMLRPPRPQSRPTLTDRPTTNGAASMPPKRPDKHALYQEAVQCPEAEVAFIDRIYRKRYGRPATSLREDFCGTALVACEWVKRRPTNQAYGVDLDQPTLDWGVKHNLSRLPPEAARRIHLINGDLLKAQTDRVDAIAALNFSYFIFKERATLLTYFRNAHRSLRPQGLFVLDAYGGYEAQQESEEETRHKTFTYIWEQAAYNPINDHTRCYIHFRLPDGKLMKRAFTYDWRLWTLGSIQDALCDAGFRETEVYWEGTAKDGSGNGVFRAQKTAENSAAWVAYIVAMP